jgi:hypothetical protein
MSELNDERCCSLSYRECRGMASAVIIVRLLGFAVAVIGVCANLLECTVDTGVRGVGGCNESLLTGCLDV